jgi:UDP-glucose 4-epimerase
VQGDLFDADSLKRAMEGVSAIVHLAGVSRTQNEDDIWRANRDGTKNLIAATKVQAPQVRFISRQSCRTSSMLYTNRPEDRHPR